MDAFDRRGIEWQTDILPKAAKAALDYFSKQNWLKRSSWYLAGGTALALRAGHRSSVDLDFFNPKKFSSQALIKKLPVDLWRTINLEEGTIYGELLGAKISFIYYPLFIPRRPQGRYGTIGILDERDIAVMKIIAISQRGRKRDFADLYWYCRNREPFIDIIRRLPRQYPAVAHNYHHIIKSLVYFADAENEPMPELFFDGNWKKIKGFFKKEVKVAAKEFLRL